MTTILIDGVAVEAEHLVCDPLPEKSTAPIVVRFQLPTAEVRPLKRVGPIVFPLGTVFYRGEFRQVASVDHPEGGVAYTYVSEGPVTEHEMHLWERPLELLLRRRPRLRPPGSSS
jgi:hypothetical protein